MEQLSTEAIRHGATKFGKAVAKNKRFYVIYKGKKINFGSDTNNTFIDHHDYAKRDAWRSRHSKIKLKNGDYAYLHKEQPEYWSYTLLW
jgi:hypothetical protein